MNVDILFPDKHCDLFYMGMIQYAFSPFTFISQLYVEHNLYNLWALSQVFPLPLDFLFFLLFFPIILKIERLAGNKLSHFQI